MSWFRSKGLELVEEEGGRVFPRSGRADDVRRVLSEEARRAGIRVRARAPVERVTLESGSFAVQSRRTEVFDRVVIATGGDWRDREGSGYRLARSLGHAATALAPSLTALKAKESWAGRLAGLTLPAAGAAWRTPEGRAVHEEGDLLFTHRGISGPLAFRVSARCAFLSFSAQSPLLLSLSVQPGSTNVDQLEQKLLALVSERPRQQLVSAVRGLVPRSLAEVIIELAGLSPESAAAHLPREGRKRLAALAARLPLAVIGREPGTEMVTAGGIALDEVDPRTMGSRLVPGLHFCGEVLDIDGFTGGWNLQAAWTTGRLAGLAIAR